MDRLQPDFQNLKQYLENINQDKIERALSSISLHCQYLYHLLPILLHYHDCKLPGYLAGEVPAGICLFNYSPMQVEALKSILNVSIDDLLVSTANCVELPIVGVYTMGSTSSIGQNCFSDLDVWICHQNNLTQQQRSKLREKCILIKQWAAQYFFEVSFFLVDENKFRDRQVSYVTEEHCGSTQNILLLDEFYRTSVRLAGKSLVWNIVPDQVESYYDDFVHHLYQQEQISTKEWFDLGSLEALSAEEYFGASLWQLYKSIDSPYKAVLKSLLLEVYSWEYPATRLLALDIKSNLHQKQSTLLQLDPYCMMLNKVTDYLVNIQDKARLELARKCFYFKVGEILSQHDSSYSWKRKELQELVYSWGWSDEYIALLDSRANWKIEQVRKAHNELLDVMMQNYRNLIRFARRNNISTSANPQDVGVLTRKLYAAFEELPGKITLFNPQISVDLSEEYLTFIQVAANKTNKPGWYLYNQPPVIGKITGHPLLDYHPYITKLIAWSYFNGLLSSVTQLHVFAHGSLTPEKLVKQVRDIRSSFNTELPVTTPKALYSPCEIKQLMVMINLEDDPTENLASNQIHFTLEEIDVFNCGKEHQCLIGSVDLLYRNSWGEIRTLHFTGEFAILEAMRTIMNKMRKSAGPPESVTICSYSQFLQELLQDRIEKLVNECIQLRLSHTEAKSSRFKALRIAGQVWGLFFERLGVSTQKLENAIDFYSVISDHKTNRFSLLKEKEHCYLPTVVDEFASEEVTQFFFEDTKQGFNIYILDEMNNVEIYLHCQGCKEKFVRDVSRFYSASHESFMQGTKQINFNLPQFYQILYSEEVAYIVPFHTTPHQISEQKPQRAYDKIKVET